ncbi:MAG: formate dehydrogenase accessory sulfurtransferase FdhD, partial [Flavobacteriales bacterium]|nr:formate dehydrogenase accessory sulfurtransferase FdhD [Flavobacteriales bacterium]
MAVPVAHERILRHEGGQVREVEDILVTEEPLEIRLGHGPLDEREEFRLSVTMRTPGNDEELALGFLFTEGLITGPEEVIRVAYCEDVNPEERGNVVRVELRPEVELDPAKWQRNFYTTSSCGVCGKSSIDAVHVRCATKPADWGRVDPALITALPDRMRAAQTVFKHTGGIHAAALFNREGELLILREDVGRHNAVDKVIGAALAGRPATNNRLLLV